MTGPPSRVEAMPRFCGVISAYIRVFRTFFLSVHVKQQEANAMRDV